MRILWTLLKVIIGLAIAIPLGILALALTVGVVGTLVGLAFLALKLAVVGFLGYGAFRLLRAMLFAPAPKIAQSKIHELPASDPYYDAALRELDRELGIKSR
jgi:threonine/homoserine/homoserine lactone efflux protein